MSPFREQATGNHLSGLPDADGRPAQKTGISSLLLHPEISSTEMKGNIRDTAEGSVVSMVGLIRLLVRTVLTANNTGGTPPVIGGEPDDSERVRVLNEAVAHFAAGGFRLPALESIARACGISSADMGALFANEEELRQACDDEVLRALVWWALEKATLEGMSEVMRAYTADPRSYQSQISYLGRAVTENTPAAARFIDVLVDESESIIRAGIIEGTMRPSDDPRALAALLAATVLGLATMGPHIERARSARLTTADATSPRGAGSGSL